MATATDDLLEGVTPKTTKDELMERLRKGNALIRRLDRSHKARVQEVEERLRAKHSGTQKELAQVIVSATPEEWDEAIKFLEEFEDLLPISLQRLVIGGRVLLGQNEAAG